MQSKQNKIPSMFVSRSWESNFKFYLKGKRPRIAKKKKKRKKKVGGFALSDFKTYYNSYSKQESMA